MPIYEYRCTRGHKHEEIRDVEKRDEPAVCDSPACRSAARLVPSLPAQRMGSWFDEMHAPVEGVYDKHLGRHIRSPEHRQQVMDEMGVVSVADVGDMTDAYRRRRSEEDRAVDEAMREHLRTYETGPDAAALKTARDRGDVPDWNWATEAIGGLD